MEYEDDSDRAEYEVDRELFEYLCLEGKDFLLSGIQSAIHRANNPFTIHRE